MVGFGIVFGLLAAASQSLAYLLSRRFTLRAGGGRGRLLVMSHALMGLVALPAMGLLWPEGLPAAGRWAWPALSVAGCYLLGHVCLFTALHHGEASRISPLLGLKLALLAVGTVVLLGDELAWMQWAAVGLTIAAAFTLNRIGGRLPGPAVGAALLSCFGYAGSDLSIRVMIEAMQPVPAPRAALFGMTVAYTMCGAAAVALLPWFGTRAVEPWKRAVPYAASWLTAMACLFTCFALAGVVLGNIVQSTRGLMSIGLGVLIAAQGWVHLEQAVSRGVFWRRAAAAAMMSGAIVLFVLGNTTGG